MKFTNTVVTENIQMFGSVKPGNKDQPWVSSFLIEDDASMRTLFSETENKIFEIWIDTVLSASN